MSDGSFLLYGIRYSRHLSNRDFEDVLARADTTDESGALKLGDVANIASIGSSVISAVENIFK